MKTLLAVAALSLAILGEAGAATLDDRLARIKDDVTAADESTVHSLLQIGMAEKRCAEVMAALKPWLQQNSFENPNALYLAAKSADLAGEWSDALSFYRKLLSATRVDARLASKAIPAFYRLLIDGLRDDQAAFLYMRKHGGRLRGYGSAKKFDPWFLRQALSRKDFLAMADRLALIHRDKTVDAAAYGWAVDKLLSELETLKYGDDGVLEAATRLADAPATSPKVGARLRWIAAIMPCNAEVAKLVMSRKAVPDSLHDAPLRAARELLQADPDAAYLVARGWLNFRQGDTGWYKRHVAVRRDAKAAPLLKLLPTLRPAAARAVMSARGPRGRDIGIFFTGAEIRALVPKMAATFNSLDAPNVKLISRGMTVDEAKKLAPYLARNPHVHAAAIRAIAVGGNSFTRAAEAALATEMWRFSKRDRPGIVRVLWDSGIKRDGDYKKVEKPFKKADPRSDKIRKKFHKKATPAERTAAFNELKRDLLSSTPSIPGALGLLSDLVRGSRDAQRVKMFIELLAGHDASQKLLVDVLRRTGGIFDRHRGKGPGDYVHPWSSAKLHKGLGPFVEKMAARLRSDLKRNKVSSAVLGIYVNSVNRGDAGVVSLITSIMESPAYASVSSKVRAIMTHREYFPTLGAESPASFSRALTSLKKGASARRVSGALAKVLEELRDAPGLPGVYGMAAVALHPSVYRDRLYELFGDLAPLGTFRDNLGYYHNAHRGYQTIAQKYTAHLRKTKNYKGILPLVRPFWAATQLHYGGHLGNELLKLTDEALAAGDVSTAAAMARIGIRFNRPNTRHNHERANLIVLKRALAKASAALGIAEIPVAAGAPGYKIYKSQSEYVQDNLDAAWSLYDENSDELEPIVRKLRHDYCFWLLTRNVEKGNVARVESLVKLLTLWDRRGNAAFTLRQQAELKLAYADVAFLKRATGTARAWYRKVADAREFKGSAQQYRAILGSVAVDRHEKNYAGAIADLDRLMLVKDDELRVKVHFARAQIFYDQEKYADADKEIAAVLRKDPKNADAMLLMGEILNRKREFESATDLEIGMGRAQKMIMPGEIIKIYLNDPSLNVTGAITAIEVELRASSGDVERVMLRPLGDGRTKYRAEIPSALGAPIKGDKILQVLGRDTITYGYSKRFRERMKDLPPDPDEKIGIAADFHLAISAGDFPPREGERRLSIEELGLSTADKALGRGRIRPGNPIYIRVIDADQSKTAGIDEVSVELTTSSGDVIKSFMLRETHPFSGEFEGQVPTTSGQAVAFAYSADPGRDPNMAISPKDYPGWAGQASKQSGMHFFGVDLNDNVELGKMTIVSPEAQAITHMVVQTSMNGREWISRASYPSTVTPWDGRSQFSAVATYGRGPRIPALESTALPDAWVKAMDLGSVAPKIAYASKTVANLKGMKVPTIAGHPGYSILLHFKASFYQPHIAQRRFKLAGFPDAKNTVFLIDGHEANENAEDPFLIDRELAPGLHTIEVWRNDSAGKLMKGLLLHDDKGGELVACPDSMFDPTNFPPAIQDSLPAAATVTPSDNMDGGFQVAFGRNTRAQLIRILIGAHRGAAPAITKVKLTDAAGRRRLPVRADYQTLRKNMQLEVLPGDHVFVKYVDDRPANPRRTQQQQRLVVAYNTAKISVSFLTYRQGKERRHLILEPIRRFRMDDNVGFVINDPDMDVSRKRDVIAFKVRTSDGRARDFQAFETEVHSGIFLGKVFPITTKPTRASEIQMSEGGTLTAIYRDEENLDPGIPTDRTVTVEHARYITPRFGVFTSRTTPIKERAAPAKKKARRKTSRNTRSIKETVQPRFSLGADYLTQDEIPGAELEAILDSSIRFDVVAPHLAFTRNSMISAYVQTEAGRRAAKAKRRAARAAGKQVPAAVPGFDVNVPGTLKLTSRPGRSSGFVMPSGYVAGDVRGLTTTKSPLDEGRFTFSVKLALGELPEMSYANEAAEGIPAGMIPSELVVRPGDKVHIGYAYLDRNGRPKWHTASVTVGGHVLLDVMDKDYSEVCTSRYIGEKVYVRIIAPALDTTSGRDNVEVNLRSGSGSTFAFSLRETFEHTGIFKGSFKLSYSSRRGNRVDKHHFFLNGLPVQYGDSITVSRAHSSPKSYGITINMGADGLIVPFSKRYGDSTVAIKTNFTLAECFFELAKQHRKMDREDLSRREMAHAEKLLKEALASHKDPEQQAQAEYLLGNLAQEYADLAKNEEAKEKGYRQALARFARIPEDYPDSLFAAKAQFKKALVYEKMNEMEIAVEEYVKLVYKYPDDERIPKAMSRLGGFFQRRGITAKKAADEKLTIDSDAARDEAALLMEKASEDFGRAANVFKKLHERFPSDILAPMAGVRAGQNMMRLGDYDGANIIFELVYDNEKYDGRSIRAQAMYWCGLSHEKAESVLSKDNWKGRGNRRTSAYNIYNRTRFDFPDSKWAKYARGRLTDKKFARLIGIDKEMRERHIESLKKR